MTKYQAINSAIEALANGEAERAVIGRHKAFGWVWRDMEDLAGIYELSHVEEVKQSDNQD